MTVPITRRQQAAQRRGKLDRIAEQVASGALTVRKASEAERKRFAAEKARRKQRKPNRTKGKI
jgi:hypothetical protein